MKRFKRAFTLLEVLVALGLMLMILGTLSYFYYQLEIINAEEEKLGKQSFRLRYVENRLSTVIPHILQVGAKVPPGTKKEDKFFFSTQNSAGGGIQPGSQSLIFNFDNGLNLEKALSNRITARLFLDDKGQLTLAMWPISSKWPKAGSPVMRKEILMEGVESLQLAFYVAPEEEKDDKVKTQVIPGKSEVMEPTPKGSWLTEWRYEYQQIPVLLKVNIRYREGSAVKTATFAFPLPNNKAPVFYKS